MSTGTATRPVDTASLVAALVEEQRALVGPETPLASRDVLEASLTASLRRRAPLLGSAQHHIVSSALAELCGLGPLDAFLADPSVSEIMVNGPGPLWVERDGVMERTDASLAPDVLDRVVERVLAPLSLRLDRLHPIVDARLPDGARVHVVGPPVAVDGPYLTVRRFRSVRVPIDAFTDAPTTALLRTAVADRRSIVVSGATGSGKTTLLGALSRGFHDRERIVTIEDTAELQLGAAHVVRLEARPATSEGVGAVSVRDLVRAALRMRPDRIVVGEVRGGEALDMVQAMSTGHRGSLSTVHADSAVDALHRLELMMLLADVGLPFEAARRLLVRAVDLVVHLERGPDGVRRVREVLDVRELRDVPS